MDFSRPTGHAGFDLRTSLRIGTAVMACAVVTACGGGSGGGASTPTAAAAAANRPPVIGGSPAATVEARQRYAFTPTASDPDGDSLTFSIAGKPAWATFDSATGALTGVPAPADASSYPNVTISVSDGKTSVALQAFTLTVTPLPRSMTLRWEAPATNVDGSAVTGLIGYQIYYGSQPDALNSTVTVADPAQLTHTIENLAPGTYYAAMRAFSSSSLASAMSPVVTKTVAP